jgi:hypothetical protein
MGEEKVRISGESPRAADAPILPTVNPAAEKVQEPAKAGIHPAFYVMSVSPKAALQTSRQLLIKVEQSLDFPFVQRYSFQQMDLVES